MGNSAKWGDPDKEEEEKKILAKPTGQGLLFGNPIN